MKENSLTNINNDLEKLKEFMGKKATLILMNFPK